MDETDKGFAKAKSIRMAVKCKSQNNYNVCDR